MKIYKPDVRSEALRNMSRGKVWSTQIVLTSSNVYVKEASLMALIVHYKINDSTIFRKSYSNFNSVFCHYENDSCIL